MMKKTFLLLLFACTFLLGQGRANAQERTLNYVLVVEGHVAGYFTECSGIGTQHEVIEHHIIGEGPDDVQKIPGRFRTQDITCKRALTSDTFLWKWRSNIEEGGGELAKDGVLILTDYKGLPLFRWSFVRGWPSSLTTGEKAQEVLVLTVDRVQRVQ